MRGLGSARTLTTRMPRLILAIETSNPSAWTPGSAWRPGVALGERAGGGVRLIGAEPVDPSDRDDTLAQAVDRVFRVAGASPADLALVAVSVGPGGFTSLRIAVASAKMLALTTGCGAAAVPSADVVARRVTPDGRPFAVALSSKGDDAWVTRYDAQGRPVSPGGLAGARDLRDDPPARLIADCFLPGSLAEACRGLGVGVEPPVFDPAACLEAAADAAVIDAMALDVVYPRPPEAVRKWQELRGGPSVPPG